MYVFCLNKLGKIEEYVPAALKMLAKLANINHATSGVATMTHSSSSTPFSNINLRSIIDMSAILSKPVEVSIDAYFNKINLDTFIQHSSKSDDYSVSLSFDSQVFGNFHVDQINVRLTSVMEGISRSIVLSSAEPLTCRQGSNTVYVSSKVSNSI